MPLCVFRQEIGSLDFIRAAGKLFHDSDIRLNLLTASIVSKEKFPKLIFFPVKNLNNNLYKVYENLFFNDLNGDIQFNKFYNSDTYLLNIESVLLLKSYYDYIVNLNQSDNDFLNINQNNNIIKRENNIGEESQYSLALNLKNIEISKKTNNIIKINPNLKKKVKL